MEIRYVKTCLGVANAMSFNKAAEHLNYGQSSVSAQIQALEEELGVHSPSSHGDTEIKIMRSSVTSRPGHLRSNLSSSRCSNMLFHVYYSSSEKFSAHNR
ncbi:MAG: LysR family transcriptional regulator [Desulfomonilaceae bacterium]